MQNLNENGTVGLIFKKKKYQRNVSLYLKYQIFQIKKVNYKTPRFEIKFSI